MGISRRRDKEHGRGTEANPLHRYFLLGAAGGFTVFLVHLAVLLLWKAPPLTVCLIDSALLLFFCLPYCYFLVYRPLTAALAKRKRAQENLQENSDLVSLFLRHSPIYAFIKEVTPTESRVLVASDNYRDMIGRTMEEMFPPDFARKLNADDWAAVTGRKVLKLDEDLNGRNYTTIKFPIFQGNRNLLAGFTIDITDRKKVEEALRESEEKFSTAFQTAPYSFTISNLGSGMMTEVNEAFLSLFGFSREETLGDPSIHSRLWKNEEDRSLVAASLSREEVVTGREFPFQKKNGEGFAGLYSARMILIHNEPCVLSNIIDITEQKKTEEALRKSQILLKSSIESIKGAYFNSIDKDYNYFYFNPAHRKRMKEFYGTEIEIGMNLLDCITKDDDKLSTRKSFDRALAGESITITKGYNSPIPCFENTFNPIRNEKGEVIGATGFALDITDRIIAEKERRKSEEYLLQMQRLESLGVLAGGIAHDFNNLLTGVFGFIDLAREEVRDPAVSDYLAQALESIERAKGLTRQLLTFSKGGAPVRKPTSLPAIVKETTQFALSGSNVKCDYAVPEDLWHCDVDRNQIGQVIQNLMINAIQAMPMGGTIGVRAENVAIREGEHPSLGGGRYVRVSIRDQGIGIPSEILPRIFDPFFTTKAKGHGLGLAISHSIVTRHDGVISVESDPGTGSVFHVYLPACGEPSAENGRPGPSRHAGSGLVIVMDDEKAVRNLVERILRSQGYTVLCRENGAEALAAYREESREGRRVRAMILDLTIPGGIGGREIAEEIRKTDGDIPLFVSSGYADDPIMAHPREFGFTASISKPFMMAELTEILEKHLGGKTADIAGI